MADHTLTWFGIVRLGLVQAAIGAIVMLATSLLNRVMVVEYALPAAIPAGLVAWHYAVQLTRPMWGHGSDGGKRRTPWIVGGMAVLAGGAILAVVATITGQMLLGVLAYAMIGGGVGAAGTSLLATLATQTAPARRPAAAALTWILMIVGIIVSAGVASSLLTPFGPQRLLFVAGGIAIGAFVLACVAVTGVERSAPAEASYEPIALRPALAALWQDDEARNFTIFVFVSMLAYSMQDMILEPFAGLMFGFTPAQSTGLSGTQHMGVLVGMILVGVGAGSFGGQTAGGLKRWTVGGCIGSALALAALALSARFAPNWPFAANVALLGFANGVFAVSAIGAMMALAGEGGERGEGLRMGLWGASQAIAFGLGGLTGAVGVDLMRRIAPTTGDAFASVFAAEAGLFLVAALLAAGAVRGRSGYREVLA